MTVLVRTLQRTNSKAGRLPIRVVFTSPEEAKAALRCATVLAKGLDAELQIIAMRVVPYPLSLTSPPIPVEFTRTQLSEVVLAAGVDADVRVYDCRNREEALMKLLPEHSLVVMSSKRRWFPTRESRLARFLRQKGHAVVLVDG